MMNPDFKLHIDYSDALGAVDALLCCAEHAEAAHDYRLATSARNRIYVIGDAWAEQDIHPLPRKKDGHVNWYAGGLTASIRAGKAEAEARKKVNRARRNLSQARSAAARMEAAESWAKAKLAREESEYNAAFDAARK